MPKTLEGELKCGHQIPMAWPPKEVFGERTLRCIINTDGFTWGEQYPMQNAVSVNWAEHLFKEQHRSSGTEIAL